MELNRPPNRRRKTRPKSCSYAKTLRTCEPKVRPCKPRYLSCARRNLKNAVRWTQPCARNLDCQNQEINPSRKANLSPCLDREHRLIQPSRQARNNLIHFLLDRISSIRRTDN